MELQTKSSVQVFDALKKAESSYKECYNNLKHIFEEK
jgi:predicted metal-dependent HD superfamily phosphohydrolase